mgnify:CR=1 FL=1
MKIITNSQHKDEIEKIFKDLQKENEIMNKLYVLKLF